MVENIYNLPEWYWTKGLHDATIVSIEYDELMYDYSEKHPDRNYLSVIIDSHNALFETDIKELRFYNVKFSDEMTRYAGYWWVGDNLSWDGNRFCLSIEVMSTNDSGSFTIFFDRAEVIRQH